MPFTDWLEIEGQEFNPGEARQASDFNELVRHCRFTPEQAVDWLDGEDLTLGQRLWLVVKSPSDRLFRLILNEKDERLTGIAKVRMDAERNGKIIVVGS